MTTNTASPALALARPQVIGSFIGATGGSVFILAHRGALAAPWSTLALVTWAVLLVGLVFTLATRAGRLPAPPRPDRRAGLVYLASCAGMLAVIAIGTRVLAASGHADAAPALVAAAVGLHLVPFAHAFDAPAFTRTGLVLSSIGIAGVALSWVLPVAAPAAAVLAGAVMLALLTIDLRAQG